MALGEGEKMKFLAGKYVDAGLLFLRIIVGGMFVFYGSKILFGGNEKWVMVGQAMGSLTIPSLPAFWGFIAGAVEFFGGICVILGLFFRPVCLLLTIVMAVAAHMHFKKGDGLFGAGHAIEDGAVFVSFILAGPGKYSFDAMISRK